MLWQEKIIYKLHINLYVMFCIKTRAVDVVTYVRCSRKDPGPPLETQKHQLGWFLNFMAVK